MAGSGGARSAGVAYIDLAVGDSKKLLADIEAIVSQAASSAQSALQRGFDVSNASGSFSQVVDAAKTAAEEAGTALQDSITSAAQRSADEAASAIVEELAKAGTQAGEQLALNIEEAAHPTQLSLFPEDLITQASEEGRKTGETLGEGIKAALDESTGSWASFALPGLKAYADEAKTAITSKLTEAGQEGGSSLAHSFEEFKQGITYSIGTWGIGYAIGNAISSGVSSALRAAKSAIFDFNSQQQSAAISFGTLTGSQAKGDQMINQVKQFSLATPFQFGDLTNDAQKLLALGVNASSVIPDLRGLGDAVSALGGDSSSLQSAVEVFGEMQSKGQVMESNLRELEIRGIPALQILSSEYGVSTTQMAEWIKQGKIMASDALPKLIDGIEHGTKSTQAMGGEMARQSLTFKGSISNLKDGLTQFAAGAFKPVFDSTNAMTAKLAAFASSPKLQGMIKPIAGVVAGAIGDVGKFVSTLVTDLKPALPVIQDLLKNFGGFSVTRTILQAVAPAILIVAQAIGAIGHNKIAATIIADLVSAFIAWKSALQAFNIVMAITDAVMDANPISLLVIGIAAAIVGFTALYQHSKTFRDIVADIGDFFGTVWHGIVIAIDFVKQHLEVLFAAGPLGFAIYFVVQVVKHFDELKNGVMTAINAVGSVLMWLWHNVLEPVVSGIWFGLRLLATIVGTLLITPFVIAYHFLEPLINALWKDVFQPAIQGMGWLATWLWKNALSPAFNFIASLFTGNVASALMWLWKSVFAPGINAIGALGSWLWNNALQPAFVSIMAGITLLGAVGEWLWKNAFGPVFSGISDAANWLWKNALSPVFGFIGDGVKLLYDNFLKPQFDLFGKAMKDVGAVAQWLYNNAVQPTFHMIGSIVGTIMGQVKGAFDTAVSGIQSTWNGLVDILRGPLNFIVNTVYTNGIREVWDFIAEKVGIPDLPAAPHFREGGVIPGSGAEGDWVPFYGTAGEGILTLDEMAALGGPAGFNRLRSALGGRPNKGSAIGQGHYDSGGIVGWLGGLASGTVSALGSGLGDLAKFGSSIIAGGLRAAADTMLKPVLNGLGSILPGNSELKQLLVGVPTGMINDVLSFFGGQDNKAVTAAGASVPGNVAQWIAQAEQAAGVDSSWTPGLETIIHYESGGNPRAINLTDSNAAAGDPSRGLMQTIMSTFEAYRLQSLPDDIYNPVANIVAGIRYILSRYGSLANVPGLRSLAAGGPYQGYATGTDGAAPGWAWVGEQGPELVFFGGGETVLTHEQSKQTAGSSRGYAGGTGLRGSANRANYLQSLVDQAQAELDRLRLDAANASTKAQKAIFEAEAKAEAAKLRTLRKELSSADKIYRALLKADKQYYHAALTIDTDQSKLTGTPAQITSATNALNKLIISLDANSSALALTKTDSAIAKKLSSLSLERTTIEKEIAAAQKYATDLSTKAADFASLGGLKLSGISGVGDIISGLKGNDSALKTFVANMAKLKQLGYSKTVIEQVAAMGPADGAVFAEALASANSSQAKEVNSLLSQVQSTTTAYGQSIANELYDSGKNAGKGFLSGLKSQEAQLTAEMTKMADAMVKAIKKFLGIRSPSRLMHEEVGLMVGAGIISGTDEAIPSVEAAATRLGVAIARVPISAPSVGRIRGTGVHNGEAGVPIVQVFIDGKEVIDRRIDVKIERNNVQLAHMLNGGRN